MEVDRIEELPENVAVRPLMPWIAAALYRFIDEYIESVSCFFLCIKLAAVHANTHAVGSESLAFGRSYTYDLDNLFHSST